MIFAPLANQLLESAQAIVVTVFLDLPDVAFRGDGACKDFVDERVYDTGL